MSMNFRNIYFILAIIVLIVIAFFVYFFKYQTNYQNISDGSIENMSLEERIELVKKLENLKN